MNEQQTPEEVVVIDQTNFHEYFHDTRHHRPQEGEVLAKFRAVAVFGDGQHKYDVIHLLKIDKAKQAAAVMNKIHLAREPDCYRICREMCEDLLSGMSEEEVAKKEYEYVLEAFYYARREYVPKDDPHWETIQLLEYDPETKEYRSKIG